MLELRPLTILCITTYEKGQEFMRECKRQECRVILLRRRTCAMRILAVEPPREKPTT